MHLCNELSVFWISGTNSGFTFLIANGTNETIVDGKMSNVLQTQLLTLPHDVFINFYAYFPSVMSSAHLDVYLTSVLGQPTTLLASYQAEYHQNDDTSLCLPSGLYQLAFVAFALPGEWLSLNNAVVTQKPCNYTPLVTFGNWVFHMYSIFIN